MRFKWEKPEFQEIGVNGECTAYAGVKTDAKAPELKQSALAPFAIVPPLMLVTLTSQSNR